MSTEVLLVRRLLEQAQPEDHVDWAASLLAAGTDTESLRILAGLSTRWDRDEVESYFRRACAELGVQQLGPGTPPLEVAALVRRAFDGEQLTAPETIRLMAAVCLRCAPREPLLVPWLSLLDSVDDTDSDGLEEDNASRDEVDGRDVAFQPALVVRTLADVVRVEWTLLDRARALCPPLGWLQHAWCLDCGHVGELDMRRRGANDRILRFPGRRDVSASAVCGHCGSNRHRWLSDPDARSAYLDRLQRERIIPGSG